MPLKELNDQKLSRLIQQLVDQATCLECCKFYQVPTTALCGHTLCHCCWIGRKKCATCGAAVDRKNVKLNLPLQKITEHTHNLREAYKKIFNIKFDDILFETSFEKISTKDPTINVKEWLADSDNQFSAPGASRQSTQDSNNHKKEMSCEVVVHSEMTKTNFNKSHVGNLQDDWDKIEEMPDTENLHMKHKENDVGPMDIETFDQFEFTSENPRRSSRKRDMKDDTTNDINIHSIDENQKKISTETESKFLNYKQKWPNVNRMKKEFSKLNKKYKSKLNVSIEMVKNSKNQIKNHIPIVAVNNSEDPLLNIDESTPQITKAKDNVVLPSNMEKDKFINNNQFKESDKVEENKDLVYSSRNTPQITKAKDNVVLPSNMEKDKFINNHQFEESDKVEENKDLVYSSRNNQVTKLLTDNSNFARNLSNDVELPHAKNGRTPPVSFIMKGALQVPSIERNRSCCDNNNINSILVNTDKGTESNDDIEITIKIGNTLTNICIKKKEKDVQFKINADKEIQTSLDKCIMDNKKNVSCSPIKEIRPDNNVITSTENMEHSIAQQGTKSVQTTPHISKVTSTTKLPSSKNTASVDTATVQYEITESVQNELSKEMDIDDMQCVTIINKKNSNKLVSDNISDEDCLKDLDLFDNDSIKEGGVVSLKSSNHPPSEILISTVKNKKHISKRLGDSLSDDLCTNKKRKMIHENNDSDCIQTGGNTSIKLHGDSELNNYDVVIGQVFANIDLDLEKKANDEKITESQLAKTTNVQIGTPLNSKSTSNLIDCIQGQSENVFSLIEKDNSHIAKNKNQSQTLDLSTISKGLSKLNKEAPDKTSGTVELMDQELSTPVQNNDGDSDEGIVEETPQKNESIHKVKRKNSGGSFNTENAVKNKSLKLKRSELVRAQNKSLTISDSANNMVINLSDSAGASNHATVIDVTKSRPTLETPLSINKFVDRIQYKSTPIARKSLNFDNENIELSDVDPEQTLCPSSLLIAKTTQEKEFMSKAFEDSPRTRAKSPVAGVKQRMRTVKYCLAGSCLTPPELANVMLLCSMRGWEFSDRYTSDVTHLVVGVDEENKSQRSVKYMCALAASKWIVSYEWVQKCLQLKKMVDEEPFEALDATGDSGPRRSRLAKQKLFEGITFFCMPPFSVLDVDSLKTMLEAAGGRVVGEAKAVEVTSQAPALLLAEPEDTQEDKFIYLAMQLRIVPVNYEWVLNCLGSYTINPLQELLLCPPSLLPPATAQWPLALMAQECD